jgi:hypothetical protein
METQAPITREELLALHEKFRDIKHSINNSLAVVMALSELAQRNPAHYEKLAKTVLTRCPDIVSQMQDFQKALQVTLKPETAGQPAPPAAATFG